MRTPENKSPVAYARGSDRLLPNRDCKESVPLADLHTMGLPTKGDEDALWGRQFCL